MVRSSVKAVIEKNDKKHIATNREEVPLLMWYPMSIEPEIGEPILFVSETLARYYLNITVRTGVHIDMPNEVKMGVYIGRNKAEVSPSEPPIPVGVWCPLPLFFFESSLRSIDYLSPRKRRLDGK